MKEINILSVKHTGGHRAGATYSCICPYCKYKSNKYRTALIWQKTRLTCESCGEDFMLINTDSDTNSKW